MFLDLMERVIRVQTPDRVFALFPVNAVALRVATFARVRV